MTIARSASRLLSRAIHAAPLSRLVLAAAVIAAGLGSLSLIADVRGAGTPIPEPRGFPPGEGIPWPETANAHRLGGAGTAASRPPAAFDPRYRFGFLEFEDDAE